MVTFVVFVGFGAAVGFGWLWWVGLVFMGGVLVYEYVIVRVDDLLCVNWVFFIVNGVIGIGLFGFVLVDFLVYGLGL